MGLFDKKYCDVCGEKIGLLGNRKLEDGNLCKACAGKLSPWFDERRHSTIAQIKEQLEYREQNRSAAAAFKSSVTFGDGRVRFYIDEAAGKFAVTSAKDFAADNPDIVELRNIRNIDLNIDEHRRELKQTVDGKSVSYNPPRYEYSYDFEVTVRVDHPYFDDMKFNLNSSSVDTGSARMGEVTTGGWGLKAAWDTFTNQNKTDRYNYYLHMGEELKNRAMNGASAAPAATAAGNDSSCNIEGNRMTLKGICKNYISNVSGEKVPLDIAYEAELSTYDAIPMTYAAQMKTEAADTISAAIKKCSPMDHMSLMANLTALSKEITAQLNSVWSQKYQLAVGSMFFTFFDLTSGSKSLLQAVMTKVQTDAIKAAAAQPNVQPQAPGRWFCTSCGTPNEGNGKFCNNCGAPRG